MKVEITEQFIELGRSNNGGWSKSQLKILGVGWPPKKKWKKKIVGTGISQKKARQFLQLKDDHLENGC